jgi:hypothetical protein
MSVDSLLGRLWITLNGYLVIQLDLVSFILIIKML